MNNNQTTYNFDTKEIAKELDKYGFERPKWIKNITKNKTLISTNFDNKMVKRQSFRLKSSQKMKEELLKRKNND